MAVADDQGRSPCGANASGALDLGVGRFRASERPAGRETGARDAEPVVAILGTICNFNTAELENRLLVDVGAVARRASSRCCSRSVAISAANCWLTAVKRPTSPLSPSISAGGGGGDAFAATAAGAWGEPMLDHT